MSKEPARKQERKVGPTQGESKDERGNTSNERLGNDLSHASFFFKVLLYVQHSRNKLGMRHSSRRSDCLAVPWRLLPWRLLPA